MKRVQQWLVWSCIVCLTCLGIVVAHLRVQAQTPSASLTLETVGLTLEELATGVYGLVASTDFPPQNPNAAICNAGIVIGSDGVLLIDPFQNEALGDLLFTTAAELTDQPIQYVLNTHYHFDHTGGNVAAEVRGVPILGRGPIRELMLERNRQQDPTLTPPEFILNGEGTIWLGDRSVTIQSVEGHSGGTDVVAYVPDADVLFTGDILFNQRIPFVSDGNIQQWQDTLNQLSTTYTTATILPGHGPVTDLTGLERLNQYFSDLESLALGWREQGLSQDEAIASASTPPSPYADYTFQGLYAGNLETAYQQITLAAE